MPLFFSELPPKDDESLGRFLLPFRGTHRSATGSGAASMWSYSSRRKPSSQSSASVHGFVCPRLKGVLKELLEELPSDSVAKDLFHLRVSLARNPGGRRPREHRRSHCRAVTPRARADSAQVGRLRASHSSRDVTVGAQKSAPQQKVAADISRAAAKNSKGHESDGTTILGKDDGKTSQGQRSSVGERWRASLPRPACALGPDAHSVEVLTRRLSDNPKIWKSRNST